MYLIIKKDDFGNAGSNYSVASHDEDRANAIGKLLALETLNDNKKQTSYALWSSDHGNLDIKENDKTHATYNNAEQEGGQAHE